MNLPNLIKSRTENTHESTRKIAEKCITLIAGALVAWSSFQTPAKAEKIENLPHDFEPKQEQIQEENISLQNYEIRDLLREQKILIQIKKYIENLNVDKNEKNELEKIVRQILFSPIGRNMTLEKLQERVEVLYEINQYINNLNVEEEEKNRLRQIAKGFLTGEIGIEMNFEKIREVIDQELTVDRQFEPQISPDEIEQTEPGYEEPDFKNPDSFEDNENEEEPQFIPDNSVIASAQTFNSAEIKAASEVNLLASVTTEEMQRAGDAANQLRKFKQKENSNNQKEVKSEGDDVNLNKNLELMEHQSDETRLSEKVSQLQTKNPNLTVQQCIEIIQQGNAAQLSPEQKTDCRIDIYNLATSQMHRQQNHQFPGVFAPVGTNDPTKPNQATGNISFSSERGFQGALSYTIRPQSENSRTYTINTQNVPGGGTEITSTSRAYTFSLDNNRGGETRNRTSTVTEYRNRTTITAQGVVPVSNTEAEGMGIGSNSREIIGTTSDGRPIIREVTNSQTSVNLTLSNIPQPGLQPIRPDFKIGDNFNRNDPGVVLFPQTANPGLQSVGDGTIGGRIPVDYSALGTGGLNDQTPNIRSNNYPGYHQMGRLSFPLQFLARGNFKSDAEVANLLLNSGLTVGWYSGGVQTNVQLGNIERSNIGTIGLFSENFTGNLRFGQDGSVRNRTFTRRLSILGNFDEKMNFYFANTAPTIAASALALVAPNPLRNAERRAEEARNRQDTAPAGVINPNTGVIDSNLTNRSQRLLGLAQSGLSGISVIPQNFRNIEYTNISVHSDFRGYTGFGINIGNSPRNVLSFNSQSRMTDRYTTLDSLRCSGTLSNGQGMEYARIVLNGQNVTTNENIAQNPAWALCRIGTTETREFRVDNTTVESVIYQPTIEATATYRRPATNINTGVGARLNLQQLLNLPIPGENFEPETRITDSSFASAFVNLRASQQIFNGISANADIDYSTNADEKNRNYGRAYFDTLFPITQRANLSSQLGYLITAPNGIQTPFVNTRLGINPFVTGNRVLDRWFIGGNYSNQGFGGFIGTNLNAQNSISIRYDNNFETPNQEASNRFSLTYRYSDKQGKNSISITPFSDSTMGTGISINSQWNF